ncbi:MAG TPA: SH3 domain-containing protein [Polyangiaceae bacterium]
MSAALALGASVLAACGKSAAVARAPERPLACTVEGDEVELAYAQLFAEAPASDAGNVRAFAQLRHATHASLRLEPPFGELTLSTLALKVHGFVALEGLPIHPAKASLFGDMVVPLSTDVLEIRAASEKDVVVMPARQPGASITIAPEHRTCDFLTLNVRAPFDLGTELGLRSTEKLDLPPGGYNLYASPDVPSSKVTLYHSHEEVDVLERRDPWVKILVNESDTALVGWIRPSDGPGGSIGHGSGTGTGKIPTCPQHPSTGGPPLSLFVQIEGRFVRVGTADPAAIVTFDGVVDAYQEVTICDPDVAFTEKTFVLVAESKPRFPPHGDCF